MWTNRWKQIMLVACTAVAGTSGLCDTEAQTSGIVAQYHCDEGSGILLYDSSPYNNNLTLNNVGWTSGTKGYGLVFNGTASKGFVTAATQAETSTDFGTGDFSLAAWFKTSANSEGSDMDKQNIICKGDPYNSGFSMGVLHETPFACIGATARIGLPSTGPIVNDNQWHYMVCVRKTGVVHLYLDGVQVHSYSCADNVTVSSPLVIGKHGTKSEGYYNGIVDEITLYNRALSESEITTVYKPYPTPMLIPYTPNPTYNRQPTLRWYANRDIPTFRIQIATEQMFSSPFISVPVTDTSYTPPADLPFGIMYWRVGNIADMPQWSQVSSFVIQDSTIHLLLPYTPDPTRNRKPALCWHPVKRTSGYSIQISMSPSFSSPFISDATNDTVYRPQVNLPSGYIYWRVKSSLNALYSQPDTFLLQNDSIPMLIPVAPDTQYNRRPVLRWYAANSASSYRIKIDLVGNFLNPFISLPLSDTTYLPTTDLPLGRIFWQVSSTALPNQYSTIDTFWILPNVSSRPIDMPERNLSSVSFVPLHPNGVLLQLKNGTAAKVSLRVYNAGGVCVARVCANAGALQLTWKGTDQYGKPLPSGAYLAIVRIGDRILASRMMSIVN